MASTLSYLTLSLLLPTLLTLPSPVSSSSSAAAAAPKTCNGQATYCTRKYSQLTHLGAHDSPFVGPLPQHNQNLEVTEQLDLGIRFLQGQTHKALDEKDPIRLCHTSCFLEDAGTLVSFLETVKTWLDAHPDEVVTLLLTNGDNLPVSRFDQAFAEAKVNEYAFVPEGSPDVLAMDKWPTLGSLIEKSKRLVVFLDYGADPKKTPYILDEFAYFFETPYGITDASFPNCSIDRPPGASPDGRMYIVNHFLDKEVLGILIPDRLHAAKTNAASGDGSIGAQSELCESVYHRLPNVVLADFVDQGEVMAAQDRLNGV
ncbi:PLC-like phosphodiesterase [Aspergillus campestris IBT 28561]|uniref:PLC-like phosphodiesterase n=1 Tax=Aspergillus campestris (strain IBT 28561) TaxID=1392248 RepID=A0A2I1D4R2_ASPC2|nr:PLC-like phosphodiesterase [Aspergillus campestris IBT 28561]PKY04859.1 PLC-like phosphodiesterase [Aspergillus campestris IBT 28561]